MMGKLYRAGSRREVGRNGRSPLHIADIFIELTNQPTGVGEVSRDSLVLNRAADGGNGVEIVTTGGALDAVRCMSTLLRHQEA